MIKLIALFAILLIISVVIWGITQEFDKCYSDMEWEGHASMNSCGGKCGGTKSTDYLSEKCISCPYLVLGYDEIRKDKEKNDK